MSPNNLAFSETIVFLGNLMRDEAATKSLYHKINYLLVWVLSASIVRFVRRVGPTFTSAFQLRVKQCRPHSFDTER